MQRAMIHSHDRSIKAVYAREARAAYAFAGRPRSAISFSVDDRDDKKRLNQLPSSRQELEMHNAIKIVVIIKDFTVR